MRLAEDLERITTGMHALRLTRRLIMEGRDMARKFPIAESLAAEIGKLCDAVETDAMEVIQKDIPAMHAKRLLVKAKAKQKVADVGSTLGEVDGVLDALDAALEGSNSGERRPTFGDSSGQPEQAQDSPKQPDPALPKGPAFPAPTPRSFDPSGR